MSRPIQSAAPAAPETRYLRGTVEEDLRRKMVFIGGPRQVGKTSLARSLLPRADCELNFDIASHRQAILRRELPPGDFWLFDEIHKYRGWRNYLKGLFDEHGRTKRILVTGSARLDLYRFGGDSLQGRGAASMNHARITELSATKIHQSLPASVIRSRRLRSRSPRR